jgi:hypothetical protein
MNCLKCGREIPESLPICPACGAVVPGQGALEEEQEERVQTAEEHGERDELAAGPVEARPAANTGERTEGDAVTSAHEVGSALLLAAPSVAAPAQSPAPQQRLRLMVRGRIGSTIAMLGSMLMFIAFFLPWFVVVMTVSSSCAQTSTVTVTTGPADPNGTGIPDWRSVFYLILVTFSFLLSMAVFIERAVRKLLWTGLTHLVLAFLQLFNFLAISSPPSNATSTETLSGFWVGFSGLITSLIGGVWMLIDIVRSPREARKP